ncbi:hypothetical protein CHS0354_019183 [Potamilus streckersoni]|uniref:CUB domain-containing protein n=1 Tax=Potamilus streckersoni TaxID=2493646 RepID=A0AAE0SB23_9BIVA|nr:hypothetical protein CHS0354_019183 [Potamilus streckersoni]
MVLILVGYGEVLSLLLAFLVFATDIEIVLSQCNGTPLTLTAGPRMASFTSPGYPTSYANNLLCTWLLDSGSDGQLIMVYSEHYDMNCAYGDSLNVYNGNTTSSTSLSGSLCGVNLVSNQFVSTGRYILVTFTSDSATAGQGFKMSYISYKDSSGTGCTSEQTISVTSSVQYLTTQNFPASYNSNSKCRWVLSAPGTGSVIHVELLWRDIENDATCDYDTIEIYSGSYKCENTFLLKDCSELVSINSGTLTFNSSTSNTMLVTFKSDGSYNKHGFILTYYADIVTTTTTVTTTTITTTASTVASNVSDSSRSSSSIVEKTEVNIPMMIGSAAAGAAAAISIISIVLAVKRFSLPRKSKKGLRTVQPLVQLPARPAPYPSPPDSLHFV